MYRDVTKKHKAWKEVTKIVAASGERVWLLQLACFNMAMRLVQRIARNINLTTTLSELCIYSTYLAMFGYKSLTKRGRTNNDGQTNSSDILCRRV